VTFFGTALGIGSRDFFISTKVHPLLPTKKPALTAGFLVSSDNQRLIITRN
jgi:hypothetical protein